MTNRIIAIYVVYNPDESVLKESLTLVRSCVDKIWITDNSKTNHDFGDDLEYVHRPENGGIAFGQNLGIRYAIENEYDWVVFFDQDSKFDRVFLDILFKSFHTLLRYDANAYGIGPMAVNMDSGVILNKKSMLHSILVDNHEFVSVRELMCSASVLRLQLFQKVGLMDESLFIDGVDFEICWRAAKLINAHFYLTKDCVLKHQLGEGDRRFLGRTTHIPTPFRVYYQVRNSIVLSKRDYVPLKWKFIENIKSLVKLCLFPFILRPRVGYFKMIIKGYYNGLINK